MPARKDAEIIATARDLFLRQGYDATSLDDVAAASGVSKTTVYNNFADKQALFRAVVLSVTARADAVIAALEEILDGPGPVATRLSDVAQTLLAGVVAPRIVQLRRLAIAESVRFPDLAEAYWQRGPEQTIRILTDALARMDASGELRVPEPRAAAMHFAYAVLGPIQDRALLRTSESLSPDDLHQYASSVVAAFLRAYAPRA